MRIVINRGLIPIFIGLWICFCMTPKVALAQKTQPGVMDYMKAQIKEGKTAEAIQAGKELIEYFNKKYPSAFVHAYIESSGEVDTVHVFTEYKDRDTDEKTRSQYMSDEEWGALFRSKAMAFFVPESVEVTVLTSVATFVKEKPVANLTQGQEGKIFFTSENLRTFKSILGGEGQSKPVTISGTLKIPKQITGKVPAVIILHGAGGINDHYFQVADMLNEMGIAAFVIDSQHSRGIGSAQALLKELFRSYSTRISDAYAALKLLSTHPAIDRNRIAVLGYSHGGRVALFVASEKIRWSFIVDDLKFAASIAYYPHCFTQLEDIDFTDAPVLMLLAEKDNICPVEACLDYAKRIKDSGANVQVIVYEGAHHMFPVLPGNKIVKVPELADWSHCGKNEYLFLREDGTWFSPHMNKTLEEVNDEYTANCRIDGEAIIGGNSEAKAESIKAYRVFLKKVFNLQ